MRFVTSRAFAPARVSRSASTSISTCRSRRPRATSRRGRTRCSARPGGSGDRSQLNHDQRKSLTADLERIRNYVENDLVRDGAHGLAVFTDDLDNLWRPLALTDSVPDAVKVDAELYLTPLVPLVGRGEGALVAVVGRERGELYRLRGGRLEQLANLSEEQRRRHDQGGWSQANYQRHADHLVQEHLQDVASELDRRARRGTERIVVVSTEETRAVFDGLLPKSVQSAIVGWTAAEAHAGPPELLAAATPILEAWRAREEEVASSAGGRRRDATAGPPRAGGRRSRLRPTVGSTCSCTATAFVIPRSSARSAGGSPSRTATCPLDGTRLEETDEGLDLALHQTLSNGGRVWAVTARGDLDPVEGIGALLRY